MGERAWIYCHGLPGSAEEVRVLLPRARWPDAVIGPGETALPPDRGDGGLHLVGFSLGAMAAIGFAAHRPDRVARLTLISAAAPLELGDFLADMAGRSVFEAARSPARLSLLTRIQAVAAAMVPGLLLSAMFRGTAESEHDWLRDPARRRALVSGLRRSFGQDSERYRKAIEAYVRPWGGALPDIACPVEIHHGERDDWAPPRMAIALGNALGGGTGVTWHPGLGHYGTLRHALAPALAGRC